MKKKFYIAVVLLFFFSTVKSQAWIQTGLNISGSVVSLFNYNNKLFLGGRFDTLYGNPASNLAYFDGVDYLPVNIQFGGTSDCITNMTELNGQLVIAGEFKAINGDTVNNIAAWDGNNWHPFGNGLNSRVDGVVSYNNELWAVGSFKINNTWTYAAKWNGSTWEKAGAETPDGWGITIYLYNNQIYVGGYFTGGVKRWNGTNWISLGTGVQADFYGDHTVVDFCEFNGNLYVGGFFASAGGVSGTFDLGVWNGNSWSSPGFNLPFRPTDMIKFQNELYMGGGYTQAMSYRYAKWDGNNLYSFGSKEPCSFEVYNNDLYLANQNNAATGNLYKLCNANDCAFLSGKVFADTSHNCAADSSIHGLSNKTITILPGPIYTTTDSLGNFKAQLLPGNYNLTYQPDLYWNMDCPVNFTISATATAGDTTDNLNYFVYPQPNIQDVEISITTGPARPGFQMSAAINYKNKGTIPMSGTITLAYDSVLIFNNCNPVYTSHANHTITWAYNNLNLNESRMINLEFDVPADISLIGHELQTIGIIEPIAGDYFVEDNTDTNFRIITNAFDPNSKELTFPRNNLAGYIQLSDSLLKYTIHFQNVGTDTAFNIVIRDTISEYLDFATLNAGASSHDYSYTLSGAGVISFKFQNILLPDSNVNEPESHGFISYSVKQKASNIIGNTIYNTAQIYFDFNPAVVTNTLLHQIIGTVDINSNDNIEKNIIKVFPNPNNGLFYIQINDENFKPPYSLLVYDIKGQIVKELSSTGQANFIEQNYSDLSKGIYFLKIRNTFSVKILKLVIY